MTATEIQQIRLSRGLTQAEFARKLGLNIRTLQDWEQGRRHPSAAAAALLVRVGGEQGKRKEGDRAAVIPNEREGSV